MRTFTVRDAFQLLKERGIARDKQEVRKWLNEGLIEAPPPENRRVGWKIPETSLQTFIRRYDDGEFQALLQRRKTSAAAMPIIAAAAASASNAPAPGQSASVSSHLIRMEDDMATLKQQIRSLRRELNDLKKVLGFPILNAAEATRDSEAGT